MKLFNRDKPAQDAAQDENFISHLVELRDRMIKSLLVVLVLFGVCFYFSTDIMRFLSQPLRDVLPEGSAPIITDVAAQFFAQTKVAFLAALLFALPWVMYQAWAFVAPGLYEHEKRFALPLKMKRAMARLVSVPYSIAESTMPGTRLVQQAQVLGWV